MAKILVVLTSHDQLGDTGLPTGFWLEELAAPYYVFKDAGLQLTLASPLGGQPPLDPKSDDPEAQTEATQRFKADSAAKRDLASTARLDSLSAADFDAIFYPGGHGPLWDLPDNSASIKLIEDFWSANKACVRCLPCAHSAGQRKAAQRSTYSEGGATLRVSQTLKKKP